MTLTLADVLALQGLESLRVRAGWDKLDTPIRWPYVAENETIAEWVMGGELVFVTGINHPRGEANLLQLVEEARACRCAGLVILTGEQYIHAIPESVARRAEHVGLPLLEQPYTLKMVLVSQLIGTALAQAQLLGQSRQHVLGQLLEGDYPSFELLRQRALGLQLSLATPRQVALLKLSGSEKLFTAGEPAEAEQRLHSHRQYLQQRLQQALNERGEGLPLVDQGEHWIALLPCEDDEAANRNRQWLARLLETLRPEVEPLRLFVGLSAAGHGAERFSLGLGEARQALVAAQSFPERLGLGCFSELGVLRLLGAIRDRHLLDRFVDEALGPVLLDDARHEPVLIPTLEAWFQENGNLALAAHRLGVHRNTLGYRLQRMETLTGRTFSDPHTRLDFSIALVIRRLSSPRLPGSTS